MALESTVTASPAGALRIGISDSDVCQLEDDIAAQRQALRSAQQKLQTRLEFERAAELSRLQERQRLLDAAVEQEAKSKDELTGLIHELTQSNAFLERQELEAGSQIKESEVRRDLELIVMRKMEAEELLHKREALDKMIWTHNLQMESIQEERQTRDATSATKLDKMLLKADRLRAELDTGQYDAEKARIANALMEVGPERRGPFRLIDEVLSKRQRRLDEKLLQGEETIKTYNRQRQQVEHAFKQLMDRKKVHELLLSRGVEFLTEIQLGNTPPMEFLQSNARAQQATDDGGPADAEEDLAGKTDTDIDALRAELVTNEERLSQAHIWHQDALSRLDRQDDLLPFVRSKEDISIDVEHHHDTFYMMRQLLVTVVLPRVFQCVESAELPGVAFLLDQLEVLQASQLDLGALEQSQGVASARVSLFTEVLEDAVRDMIHDVALELQQSVKLSCLLTGGVCRSVINDQCQHLPREIPATGDVSTQALVEMLFREMKRERDVERSRGKSILDSFPTHICRAARGAQYIMHSDACDRFSHSNMLISNKWKGGNVRGHVGVAVASRFSVASLRQRRLATLADPVTRELQSIAGDHTLLLNTADQESVYSLRDLNQRSPRTREDRDDISALPTKSFASDLHRFAFEEQRYWANIRVDQILTLPVFRGDKRLDASHTTRMGASSSMPHPPLPSSYDNEEVTTSELLKQSRLTCSAFSSDGEKLVLCSDAGGIMVYDLRPLLMAGTGFGGRLRSSEADSGQESSSKDFCSSAEASWPRRALLCRFAVLGASHTGTVVTSVSWDMSNTSIVTTDSSGTVGVYSMVPRQHDVGLNVPNCLPAQLLCRIPPTSMYRAVGNEEPSVTARRRCCATWAGFHPSFTVAGTNPSLTVTLRDGAVVKWNRVSPLSCISGPYPFLNMPAREPPCAASTAKKSSSRTTLFPTREFFVSKVHKTQVLLVGFIRNSGCSFPLNMRQARIRTSEVLREYMVTVDVDGYVCVWRYSPDQFCSYAWFVPEWHSRVVALHNDFQPVDDRRAYSSEGNVLFALDTASEQHDSERSRISSAYLQSLPSLSLEFPCYKKVRFADGSIRRSYIESQARCLADVSARQLAATCNSARRRTHVLEKEASPFLGVIEKGVEVEMHHFTYGADGVLLRHTTSRQIKETLRGRIVQAELTKSGSDLLLLTRYDIPPGCDHHFSPTHTDAAFQTPDDRPEHGRSFIEVRMLGVDRSFAPTPVALPAPSRSFEEHDFGNVNTCDEHRKGLELPQTNRTEESARPSGSKHRTRLGGLNAQALRPNGSCTTDTSSVLTGLPTTACEARALVPRVLAPMGGTTNLRQAVEEHCERRRQLWYLDYGNECKRSRNDFLRSDVVQRLQYEKEAGEEAQREWGGTLFDPAALLCGGTVSAASSTSNVGQVQLTPMLIRVEVDPQEQIVMQCSPALQCPGGDFVYLFAAEKSIPHPPHRRVRCMVFSLTTWNHVASYDLPVFASSFQSVPLRFQLCPMHRFIHVTPDMSRLSSGIAPGARHSAAEPVPGSTLFKISDHNTVHQRAVYTAFSSRELSHRIGPLTRPRYPVEHRVRHRVMSMGTLPRVTFEYSRSRNASTGTDPFSPPPGSSRRATLSRMNNEYCDVRKYIQLLVRQLVVRAAGGGGAYD